MFLHYHKTKKNCDLSFMIYAAYYDFEDVTIFSKVQWFFPSGELGRGHGTLEVYILESPEAWQKNKHDYGKMLKIIVI